jgi:anti-sigma factor RsiW
MRCKEIADHVADYLGGSAEPAVRSSIEAHLATCAGCKFELESLEAVWEQLEILPDVEPRPEMRARFQAMLKASEEGMGATGGSLRQGRRTMPSLRDWLRPALAFQFSLATALLFIGGMVGRYVVPTEKSNKEELSQLREEIHGMRQLVAVSLLRQDSASERLEGVSWSNRLRQPDEKVLDALIGALNHDTSVDVRLAAVDALYRFSDRPVVRQELVQSVLRQSSPLVQIALIDLMVELREKQSEEILRRLASDTNANQSVREHAKWGLQKLS